MTSDLIGRRRAVEERLDRARVLERTLKEATDVLADLTAMSIEQLDFDGSFRAALSAVAGVALRRPQFDVVVSLPDAPFAVRIRLSHDAVSADVIVQRGGPYEPLQNDSVQASAPRRPDQNSHVQERIADSDAPTGPAEVRNGSTQDRNGFDEDRNGSGQVASDLAALLWQGVEGSAS